MQKEATFPVYNLDWRRRSSPFSDNPQFVAFEGDYPHLLLNQSNGLTASQPNGRNLHQIRLCRLWMLCQSW